jgi:hypothetical protein
MLLPPKKSWRDVRIYAMRQVIFDLKGGKIVPSPTTMIASFSTEGQPIFIIITE